MKGKPGGVSKLVDCLQCGGPFWRKSVGRPAIYCSSACRDAANAGRKANGPRQTYPGPKPDPNPVPHGTSSGYNWHRCRCKKCQQWNAEYKRSIYQPVKREVEG